MEFLVKAGISKIQNSQSVPYKMIEIECFCATDMVFVQ